MLQSHTASQQWQSFEIRMRRRRIDRCVLRAAVALDGGVLQDAREALDEVQRLDPHEPAVEPLRARLVAAELAATQVAAPQLAAAQLRPAEPPSEPAVVVSEPAVAATSVVESAVLNPAIPDTPAPEEAVLDTLVPEPEFLRVPEAPRRLFPASAAAAIIAFSGAAGWFLFTQYPPAEPAGGRIDKPVVYDSMTTGQQTPPIKPAVADPAVRIAETAVTAAATSEPVDTASEPVAAPDVPAPTAGIRDTAVTTPLVPGPRPAPAAAVDPSTATTTAASTPTPPPPVERPAVQATLDPTPSLPDPPRPAPAVPTSGAVSGMAGTEAPGTSVTLTPPADPPAPKPAATPTTSSAPAASASSGSPQADEGQVRAALHRYESAYSALDAAAASAVWPGVDRRALTSAFQALSSQNVSLGRCDVRVSGATAQAECSGTARWQPKVGTGPQAAHRQWRFDLRNTGNDWIITRATVR